MAASHATSRVLIVAGLAAMLVGAIDPLEGSFIVLGGVGVAALGATIDRSRYRRLLGASFALVALGVVLMVVLSWLGGVGGNSGRSIWWALLVIPYPIGWLAGLVGAIAALSERKTASTGGRVDGGRPAV